MRILLVGPKGYLGQNLLTLLNKNGSQVFSYSYRPEMHEQFVQEINKIVTEMNIDVAIIVGSDQRKGSTQEDVLPLVASNIAMPLIVASALSSRIAPTRLVTIGTIWESDLVGDTDENYFPRNLYAATKAAIPKMIRHYGRGEMHSVHLRLGDVYGPNDKRAKVINALLGTIRDPQASPLVLSSGNQILYPIHIVDVLEAISLVVYQPFSSPTASASSVFDVVGKPWTLREIATELCAATGYSFDKLTWNPRISEVTDRFKAQPNTPLPGWSPLIPLSKGLETLL